MATPWVQRHVHRCQASARLLPASAELGGGPRAACFLPDKRPLEDFPIGLGKAFLESHHAYPVILPSAPLSQVSDVIQV